MRTSVKTPYFTSYSSDSQSFRDDSPFFSKTLNGAGEKARSVVEGRFLYVSFSVQKLPWDATGLSMLNLFGESVPESATVTEWDAGEEVSVEIYDGIGTEKWAASFSKLLSRLEAFRNEGPVVTNSAEFASGLLSNLSNFHGTPPKSRLAVSTLMAYDAALRNFLFVPSSVDQRHFGIRPGDVRAELAHVEKTLAYAEEHGTRAVDFDARVRKSLSRAYSEIKTVSGLSAFVENLGKRACSLENLRKRLATAKRIVADAHALGNVSKLASVTSGWPMARPEYLKSQYRVVAHYVPEAGNGEKFRIETFQPETRMGKFDSTISPERAAELIAEHHPRLLRDAFVLRNMVSVLSERSRESGEHEFRGDGFSISFSPEKFPVRNRPNEYALQKAFSEGVPYQGLFAARPPSVLAAPGAANVSKWGKR